MQTEKTTKGKRMCYDAVHKMLLDTKQTPCGPFGWGGTIRTFAYIGQSDVPLPLGDTPIITPSLFGVTVL